MLRLRKDHPKQPIPDWSFRVDETLLRDKTADGLIAKLVQYRGSNGQSPGHPEHEIALSLSEKYPHLIGERTGELPPPTEEEQVMQWVNGLWREAPRGSPDDEETKTRVESCKLCPWAKPLKPSPEQARRAHLLAHGNLQLETRCAHHRWHNGLAVNLKNPLAWAQPLPPTPCWVGRLP